MAYKLLSEQPNRISSNKNKKVTEKAEQVLTQKSLHRHTVWARHQPNLERREAEFGREFWRLRRDREQYLPRSEQKRCWRRRSSFDYAGSWNPHTFSWSIRKARTCSHLERRIRTACQTSLSRETKDLALLLKHTGLRRCHYTSKDLPGRIRQVVSPFSQDRPKNKKVINIFLKSLKYKIKLI